MHTYQIQPKITTARGIVKEWPDLDVSWDAYAHYKRQYYETHLGDEARRRAEDPDYDERNRRSEEQFLAPNPEWAGVPIVPISPDMPDRLTEWEFEQHVYDVRVLAPESSITVTFREDGGNLLEAGRQVVNPRYVWRVIQEAPFNSQPEMRPNPGHSRDDLDGYCHHPHWFEALALLNPRCFFHGRIPLWEQRSETIMLGRPAYVVPLRREIPLSDPRLLGDEYNPCVFDETDETEVVVDIQRNVVLEWRALFGGKVYERHYFTELHFDEPMDEADFYPEGRSEA